MLGYIRKSSTSVYPGHGLSTVIGIVDWVILHLDLLFNKYLIFVFLRAEKHFCVSAVKGCRAVLALVLHMKDVDISTSWEISMLIKRS